MPSGRDPKSVNNNDISHYYYRCSYYSLAIFYDNLNFMFLILY